MPKQVYLAPHFSPSDLRDKYRNSKDPVEARRWHFLWKVALGWTVTKSALAVGISQSYGWKILKNYNAKGLEGVKNEKKNSQEHSRGSKPLLSAEQLQKLREEIKKQPSDGGIWTGPKVARWIEKEIGIEKVWNQRGWDYLNKAVSSKPSI
jgi:hypothetical protein